MRRKQRLYCTAIQAVNYKCYGPIFVTKKKRGKKCWGPSKEIKNQFNKIDIKLNFDFKIIKTKTILVILAIFYMLQM